MSILGWMRDRKDNPAAGETDSVRRIVEELDRMDPQRARYIAAFAYILGRAALADREVSAEETRAMERLMQERAGLPEDQAIIVVQIAKSQNALFGGTEDFLVTREFNEIATEEQKLTLLDCLFAVSASDDAVTTVEDNEVRRIAMELKIGHDQFVRARLAYRESLSVLKHPPSDRD